MELESFRAHHGKEGSKFVDWQKAWSTWILNTVRFARERHSHHAPAPSAGYLKHVVEHVLPELEREDEE
jgi:hypothetical protein